MPGAPASEVGVDVGAVGLEAEAVGEVRGRLRRGRGGGPRARPSSPGAVRAVRPPLGDGAAPAPELGDPAVAVTLHADQVGDRQQHPAPVVVAVRIEHVRNVRRITVPGEWQSCP